MKEKKTEDNGNTTLIPVNDFLGDLIISTAPELKEGVEEVQRIEDDPGYIKPLLKVIHKGATPRISIISAPGAVGKTTFAKYCSYFKRSYYWDLSKIKLGDNTFIGTLAKRFGPTKLSEILSGIDKGKITNLFDAIDEAEIISGWDGVESFVKEVYQFTANSPNINVVLFARSETASLLQLLIEELGGTEIYSMFEIDYFDEKGSIDFVKKYLSDHDDNSYKTHTNSFDNALSNIFKTISKGLVPGSNELWEDREIRSFIGYSPVLQTISSFIANQNYEAIAQRYQNTDSEESGAKVISQFIKDLLDREQKKVIDALKIKITNAPKDWNEWESLYTPTQQLKYTIEFVKSDEKTRIQNVLSNIKVPSWLHQDYTEAVSQFIGNHPFIRGNKFNSPSFRDYSIGQLITDRQFEPKCVQYLQSGSFALTPLFAFFYADANDNKCKGPHVGYLYESSSSRVGLEQNALYTFIKHSNKDIYVVEIINPAARHALSFSFECLINDEHPLTFERRLYNATINVESKVILGGYNSTMELMDVDIKTKQLEIRAKELIINCHENSSSQISAEVYRQTDHSLILKKIGSGNFEVSWPNSDIYPWTEYHVEYEKAEGELNDELYALRRLLTPFRKHGRGNFSKHKDFIDQKIVGSSDIRQDLLGCLFKRGIVTVVQERNHYEISQEAMEQLGFSWSELRSLKPTGPIINFLNEFRRIYKK